MISISKGSGPSVTLLVPVYNEAGILEANLKVIVDYMRQLSANYDWELVVVNDGSEDGTAERADAFAAAHSEVRIMHHPVNFGLGQALKTGFRAAQGEYVVTLDIDLSYAPDHIDRLLTAIRETGAKVVIASPYMPGGTATNVPRKRLLMSRWANRFISLVAPGRIYTFTGMVRAYDGRFLKSVNLKSMGMDVNMEIIYKATLLRARIIEIPGHLNWLSHDTNETAGATKRKSSMHVPWHTLAALFSGFVFRPFLFFFAPGFILLLLSCYVNIWICIHVVRFYQVQPEHAWFANTFSDAVRDAFQAFPHTFFIGGVTLVIAIQLLSLGFLSMQNKRYFEELFHLTTAHYRRTIEYEEDNP